MAPWEVSRKLLPPRRFEFCVLAVLFVKFTLFTWFSSFLGGSFISFIVTLNMFSQSLLTGAQWFETVPLGGGFKHLLFSHSPGEKNVQFDSYFSKGVETATYSFLAFQEDDFFVTLHPSLVKVSREELALMWRWVCSNPAWSSIWEFFCAGHVNLQEYRALDTSGYDHGSPDKSKPAPDAATPEKDYPPMSASLVPGGDAPLESVTAVVSCRDGSPPKKKKRTGKALAPCDKIKYNKYFSIWLAERGLTYRIWMSQHCRMGLWDPVLPWPKNGF